MSNTLSHNPTPLAKSLVQLPPPPPPRCTCAFTSSLPSLDGWRTPLASDGLAPLRGRAVVRTRALAVGRSWPRRSNGRRVRVSALRMADDVGTTGTGTGTGAQTGTGTEAMERDEERVDALFARLTHVNKSIRKKSSAAISEVANDADIARLLRLLRVDDVSHRRQAVQTLGMIGVRTLPSLSVMLADAGNDPTIRASCAKAIAAVSLFYPEARESFPSHTLDLLQSTLQNSDPVTKLSVVGCLGSLGSDNLSRDAANSATGSDSDTDAKDLHIHKGSERAVDILRQCVALNDMAITATAVSALAQIAQNGSPQRKHDITTFLQQLCEEDSESAHDEDIGFNYVREIVAGHLEQLEGKQAN